MQYTDIDTLLQRAHAAAPALVAMDECSRTQVLNDVADQAHGVVLRNILVYSLRKKYRLVW